MPICNCYHLILLKVSLEHIRKAEVVQQTQIIYKDKELLQLILNHLVEKGLDKSANILQKEANLTLPKKSAPTPQSTQFYDSPSNLPVTPVRIC